MAATFQYAKQYSWSKIKRARQAPFHPVPLDEEDERGSSQGLLEKGSAGRPQTASRSLWRDPTFLLFHGALLTLYLLVLGLVAAGKGPSCAGAPGVPYCKYSPRNALLEKMLNDSCSAGSKSHRVEGYEIYP